MVKQLDTMQAIFIEDFGGADQLKKGLFPIPTLEADEVQIKIAYAAVIPK